MRWIACVLAVTLLTRPVLAGEPWEGSWVPIGQERSCDAEQEGSAGLLLKMSASNNLAGYTQWGEDGEKTLNGDKGQIYFETDLDPVTCNIQNVTKIAEMPSYIFDVECGGEGSIWKWRYIAMLSAGGTEDLSVGALKPDGERLFLYDGSSVETYSACSRGR
jgi:hypothetical protein